VLRLGKLKSKERKGKKMTNLKALEVSLTLIDLFNSGLNECEERQSVENVLERTRFKELKSFSFKNLKRFHEMNLESLLKSAFLKIPNNGAITPENTLKAEEINFYLEYLEEHTIYVPKDWEKIAEDDPHSQYSPTQLKALATDNSNLRDIPSDCR
jgi:hypothetical protein